MNFYFFIIQIFKTMNTPQKDRKIFNKIRRERYLKFIEKHPYPSFKGMQKVFDAYNEHEPMSGTKINAEYGEFNHECMKKIYYNLFDKDLVRKMGDNVGERGGFRAMEANYYALSGVSRTMNLGRSKSIYYISVIGAFPEFVSEYWDGLYGWMH